MGSSDASFTYLCERITKLETSNCYQAKKIDEIHKILVGNGHPGLIAEWNQMQGAYKFFTIAISSIVAALGLCVAWIKIG